MASKKPVKSAKKAQAVKPEVPKPPSSMDTLKAAIAGDPVGAPKGLGPEFLDPAIAGAVRKSGSNVVELGMDSSVAEDAREASALTADIRRLNDLFNVRQGRLREYGREKQKAYNKVFHADVVTVAVPFTKEAGEGDLVRQTSYVQVICTGKYSVTKDPVLAAEDNVLSGVFDQLFLKKTTKVLRPSSEELVRGILAENGISEDNMQKAMELLFEEVTDVSVVDDYEALEQEAPEDVRSFLAHSVVRQQPTLRFEKEK